MKQAKVATSQNLPTVLRVGGVVSMLALFVGMAADTLNVMDVVQTELLGKKTDELIEARYPAEDIAMARQAQFVRRYLEHCLGHEEVDGAVTTRGGMRIDIFHCGEFFLAARVIGETGVATMSEISLPTRETRTAAISLPDGASSGAAHAQERLLAQAPDTQTLPVPPAPIARSLCRRDTATGMVVRYQLTDGMCMDETIDGRTAAVVQRTIGVPCDCDGFG